MSRAGLWTLLLAVSGGFVDAVGFLALFHIFTAHMSGNSVWFGTAFGLGDWRLGLHHLFPIPLFVLGIVAGTIAVELAQRRQLRAAFTPALVFETVLLAAFMLVGAPLLEDGVVRTTTVAAFYGLAALPPLAMGVQNATLRRIAGQAVHTTYVTGVLQSVGEGLARFLLGAGNADLRGAVAALSLWVGYVAGAIAGGFGHQHYGLWALVVPIGLLAIVVAVDLVRPDALR